jgi:hypothetical protein
MSIALTGIGIFTAAYVFMVLLKATKKEKQFQEWINKL